MRPTCEDDFTPEEEVLAVALELSSSSWKIAFQDGKHAKPALVTVSAEQSAARLSEVEREIGKMRKKWQIGTKARTVVLYEAGQDGFWIQRALSDHGIKTLICDPSSIPMPRKHRRAKTDRLDAIKLVSCLRGWLRGEIDRMHVIKIPTDRDEAQRHLSRDRGELIKERGQHRDRIRKLLRTIGCWTKLKGDVGQQLQQDLYRCYDGAKLPAELKERLLRESERLAFTEQQLNALELERARRLPKRTQDRITCLQRLKAVGEVGATRLVLELLWRQFNNGKQVGACLGLVPQPFDSGQSRVDQGISKQGNRRVRSLMIEMAWFWLRYQPDSAISKWFAARTAGNAIALWRYLEHGIVPEGAALKAA
jgi:transposase